MLITHDRAFTERRKRHSIGRHVRLCVEHPDGPEVLKAYIDVVAPILAAREHVVIELRQDGFDTTTKWV